MANRKPLVVIDGVLNEIPSSDSLVSTGGINNTPVGNVAPSTVAATTINASGQITSTVSTGTAPLVVASTTKVTNLNVDLLDGKDSTDFIDTSATAQTKAGDLTISGNLTVHGTTTTIDSETLVVKDKNIELGVVTTPTDTTADGGGITLKGTTDKSITWNQLNSNWTSTENYNLLINKTYQINNVTVLSSTTLGSSVVNSSLTSVGTITAGVWNAGAVTSSGAVQGIQLVSTVATGTAPLTVASTTAVTNLNSDMLDGMHASTTNVASTVMARDAGGVTGIGGIQLDTGFLGASAVGLLSWDVDSGTAQIGLAGGNAVLQIGQEEVTLVYNSTAATLTDMQVVRVTGAQGNNLTVALAQANSEANSANSLAVVTESIAVGTTGFATRGGVIHNIDTSAFAEGAALWLSPTVPGGITTTKPTAPNHLVLIGWVVRSHALVGQIFVHIQNGYELDELHDVLINGRASGNTLIYDATAGVWKNAYISGSTNVVITNGPGSITISLPSTITSNTSGNAATVTNGVYTTGSYNDPAWLTGVNYSKLVGTVPTWNQNTTGTAANVTGVVAIANGGTGGTTVSQAQTNLQVDPAGTAIQMAIALG